ncbi:MAG: Sec-independent protein translocase protein TatB [Gammaproteobacteria bacterium]|nr:Sec-independent protein translocase protein TatB [Gammaproteobacteria bacterium]
MFDIGFPELVLIAVVGLLVIGPERLPETLRTLGLWLGRMRRSFAKVKNEIEAEIGMDEVRRQLHNESVMEEMKRIEAEVRGTADDTRKVLEEASILPGSETSSREPPPASDASSASTPVDPAPDTDDAAHALGTPDDNPPSEEKAADEIKEQPTDGARPANEANG